MALQARSQNRRVLLGSQPIPAATRQSLGTSQRGFFIHLPPNSLDYRDRYGLQQVRYVKAIVPIGLGKQSGILCVVQLLEQRIVALAVTRTHACFENRLRVFNAPTEPRRLALNIAIFGLYSSKIYKSTHQAGSNIQVVRGKMSIVIK